MSRRRGEPTEEQRERARALRAQLLADSALARLLVETGEYDSVNEALVAMYEDEQNTEFNMFHQWRKLGRPVKKGERCRYPVWGQPVDREKPGAEVQPGAEGEDDTTRFWPMAYLFSNTQVS